MNKQSNYKNFEEFFKKATKHDPYPYQKELAELSTTPSIINIPTGAGKTEAAILCIWLWKRLENCSDTPRRLIYCLPRRVLVEQTKKRVEEWLEKLDLKINVYLLMGGNNDEDLEKHPEQECVIIGTQDMLISGALNRTYGSSPYKWPILFGLFNNDVMWIMDEIQIMENALPTSIQLDAFRKSYGTYGPHHTVWMSATINQKWLKTTDSSLTDKTVFSLTPKDANNVILKKRNNAVKNIHKADIELKKQYSTKDIKIMYGLHQKGTITAIMVNTVKRAQELYDLFKKEGLDCKLIHSRFRSKDREKLNEWIQKLKEEDDKIIISTQVLEAGVDISVRTLITEITPWASMVQRFGRCNRKGTFDVADIYWIDITDEKNNPPYEPDNIEYSRKNLLDLTGKSVSPENLPPYEESKVFDAVLRRRDIIDLFDTTSDLSGNYVDASRFVRTIEEQLDVEVFWRDDDLISAPDRAETCSVSLYELKEFMKKNNLYGYVWNYKDKEWEKCGRKDVFSSQKIMFDSKKGGYNEIRGWDKNCKEKVSVLKNSDIVNDSHDADPQSYIGVAVTLEDHTKHVINEIKKILENIEFLDDEIKDAMKTVAKYHDIGKTHQVFQNTMKKGITKDIDKNKMWAKSEKSGYNHERPGFRHEVASALAYLNTEENSMQNLVAYLIISHHGKVRLALRNVSRKRNAGGYLLGMDIEKKDELPEFSSSVVSIDKTIIDMSIAQIGSETNPSWTQRALALRDKYGPFRLGYLELIIRAADMLASKKEQKREYI